MELMTHRAAGWKIRLRMSSDNQGIEALFDDCLQDFPWRSSGSEETIRMRKALASSDCLIAHEAKAGVVGFLILERPKAYVSHLFVHRNWRFCGVGGGLLDVARDMARSPLQLDVDIQNEPAMRAYKAMGWIEKVGAVTPRGGQRRLAGP